MLYLDTKKRLSVNGPVVRYPRGSNPVVAPCSRIFLEILGYMYACTSVQ